MFRKSIFMAQGIVILVPAVSEWLLCDIKNIPEQYESAFDDWVVVRIIHNIIGWLACNWIVRWSGKLRTEVRS